MARMRQLRGGRPMKRLTAAQRDRFDADGVLLPMPGVGEAEAARCRRLIEDEEGRENTSGNSLFLNGHLVFPWQHSLATNAAVLDVVEDLIGPNVRRPCVLSHCVGTAN